MIVCTNSTGLLRFLFKNLWNLWNGCFQKYRTWLVLLYFRSNTKQCCSCILPQLEQNQVGQNFPSNSLLCDTSKVFKVSQRMLPSPGSFTVVDLFNGSCFELFCRIITEVFYFLLGERFWGIVFGPNFTSNIRQIN